MPFHKGQSGNPGGLTKARRLWITEAEKFREAKASWRKLVQIRQGLVLERKQIGLDPAGQPIIVDVVPNVRDYIACCKEILDRAIGKPKQEVEVAGKGGGPIAVKSVDGFDWDKYADILGSAAIGSGDDKTNGDGQSVYPAQSNGKTSGIP